MGDGYERESYGKQPDDTGMDKRIEDIKRIVTQGANEAQVRFKRVVERANDYWQQTQTAPVQQATSVEEQRIRQLVNGWSNENWRVARDLGNYIQIVSWSEGEVWEANIETRWETRVLEVVSEPYTGRSTGLPRPMLPVWDYELPPVVGLKAPTTRTRLEGRDEVVGCTNCNGTGHVLCANCNGRGWIVCPDCKGRTKKRCTTCRGRGYVADWGVKEKKPFLKKQAENVTSSVTGKLSDVVENIRQQGVPIPNPIEGDPAAKGPTIPCPDCVKGEVDCTCGNGKRVCATCEGARMSLCANCGGTAKVVRHREIVRSFDLRTQTRSFGENVIPSVQLQKANGDLVYNAEVDETLHAEAVPENVPTDIWHATVELVHAEAKLADKPGIDPQSSSRPTLQVIELVRIPYIKLQYRYADEEYVLYIYDCEGQEKFYADRFPARWDRIERLVKSISSEITTPIQQRSSATDTSGNPYRVPVDVPPYEGTDDQDPSHFNPR